MTEEKLGSGHGAFAFELDLAEEEGGGASADEDAEVIGAEDHAWGAGLAAVLDGGKDFELAGAVGGGDESVGGGPGVHGADLAFDLGGGLVPEDRTIFAAEFGGVIGLGLVLGEAGSLVGEERGEGIGEGEGGEVGEAIVEGAGGFASADGEGELGEDIAGIEAFGHIHDGDACSGIIGEDGGLDGGGAAPAWEEGGVKIEAGEGGEGEDFLGEDLAVSHDDDEIGVEVGEGGDGIWGAEFEGLEDGEVVEEGEIFDGGRAEG